MNTLNLKLAVCITHFYLTSPVSPKGCDLSLTGYALEQTGTNDLPCMYAQFGRSGHMDMSSMSTVALVGDRLKASVCLA